MILSYPTAKGKAEKITQLFGKRPEVYKQFGLSGHNGLDFGISTGTLILSIGDGKVLVTGDEGAKVGYGKYIKIQHDGYQSTYAHLNEFLVKTGDVVKSGQQIAKSDNTGFSTGPHLHLTIKETDIKGTVLNMNNGYKGAIDPLPLLNDDLQNIPEWSRESVKLLRSKGVKLEEPEKALTKYEFAKILNTLGIIK